MKVVDKESFMENIDFYASEMKMGKIFVYPTDTIYGIGCNALNQESVLKIRDIKKRDEKPFSVIAPSKEWIKKNCYVNDKVESWISKLPGKLTLILELKDWEAVSKSVNFGFDSLGVRIPNNWFSEIVENLGFPFVTTSVNVSGEKPICNIYDISEEFKNRIDYCVEDGLLEGSPSKIVNLLRDKEEVIER